MNKLKNYWLVACTHLMNARRRRAYRLWAILASAGLVLVVTLASAQAEDQGPLRFNLVPASDAIGACLPNANTEITVFPKEDTRGVDTLDLKAEGLTPNTTFAVFLTEGAVSVGAVQYIGDFTTNAAGRGSMRVDSIIEEAFASQPVNGQRVAKPLNHIVFWFADPDADETCVPGSGPSPFDGDGQGGVAVMSSKNFLPGAPLP